MLTHPEVVTAHASTASRRLRITFVLPQLGLAGGIRTVRQLGEALAARGHHVVAAHLAPHEPWPPPWRVRTFVKRLRREWAKRGTVPHHFHDSPLPRIEVAGDRIRAEDVPDADVCIGTWWPTLEWMRDWPPSKGLHAYYVQHFETHAGDPERVLATYRQPALKLVISGWLEHMLRDQFGPQDFVRVPNGLDWEQFDSEARPPPETPTVGMMVSPRRWKGTALAFEAFEHIRRARPEVRLLAFGEGLPAGVRPPEGAEIVFHPDQSALPALYQRCSCWIVASETEGFGLPGLEAAASHCPVVSTRCGGPEDYVHSGETGYLVPVGDAEALATRVLDALGLDAAAWRRMSAASYHLARTFRWERTAAALEAGLLAALEKPSAGS